MSLSSQTVLGPPAPVDGQPFSWRFTAPLFLGSSLNAVNTSLLATALVPIARGLGVPLGQTAALVTCLYLASAIAQPTAGKAAEVFGPRRIFLTGIALVAIGGLVGGIAQNLTTLLISRVLIGLGSSCAYPTAMLIIRQRALDAGLSAPPGGVLGGLQIAGTATSALGLPLGGLLVGALGWRSIFFMNIPVAILALLATVVWIAPDTKRKRLRAREIALRLDATGIIGFAAAMIALLLFLFELPATHWYYLAISVVLFAGLVSWEKRIHVPFLDVRLLASNRPLTRTYVRFGLVLLCVYVVLYGITQWVETVRGLSETATGLLLLPMSLVSAIVVVPMSRRNLVRLPVIVAAVSALIGSGGVLLLSASASILWVAALSIVFGVCMGAAATGNQLALYSHAPSEQLGTAAGLLRTFGYVGSIAASAITGIVFHTRVTDHGVHLIAFIMIGVSIVVTIMTLADRSLSAKN